MANVGEQQKPPICVWLDSSADSHSHSLKALENYLKSKLENFEATNNINDFENFIESHEDEKILLLVSGSYGRRIVPKMHSLQQLCAIYVYCSNKDRNLEWAKEYPKVGLLEKLYLSTAHLPYSLD